MRVTSEWLTTMPANLGGNALGAKRRSLPGSSERASSSSDDRRSKLADQSQSGIVTRVAAIMRRDPEAIAVSAPGTTLTYRALFARALEHSARLRATGVRPGDLVALCVPRSADFVVGALGILLSGAAYVALDPDQPDARLRYMLEDCSASVLLAHNDIADRLQWSAAIVCPSTDQGSALAPPSDDPPPDAAAYAVYTSGSTGAPKAVLVSHAGLLNLIDWHQTTFGLIATDRTTLIANPGFDAAAWEIWPSLTAGASLHIPPDEVKTDPIRLRDWLLSERITVCFVPTPLAETLISISWPSSAPLRWLLTGGDVLHHRPPVGLPFQLVNNYGVSEASVVSTSGIVSAATHATSAPHIGAPIDGVTLRVVDEQGTVLPAGAAGELLICGRSVALGYLGSPVLTAQKFFADPLNPTVRAYRTGDRVRITDDGTVEFLGRLDDQVQIRGVRVETSELVAATHCHPDVAACAVVPCSDVDEIRLVMFVVPRQPDTLQEDQLCDFLRQRMPEQMMPATIVTVPELPVTGNGKIDKGALAEFATSLSPTGDIGSPAARTDVESVLAGIVAALLRRSEVGVEDNFFLLGGHSMLGAQLIVRIAQLYGVEMTLLTLFEHPTVAALAAEVERLVIEEIADMSDDELLRANAALSPSRGES